MKKLKKISLDGDLPLTSNLFGLKKTTEEYFPTKVYRDEESFKRILETCSGQLGLDFEFRPDCTPTIIGISTPVESCAIYCLPSHVSILVETVRKKNIKLVGHSVIGAERQVIKKVLGIEIPMSDWDDTMLRHFLLNMDLAKAPDKHEDDDKGALGFMNLWTCASMVLDVPNTKQCREEMCDGIICPRHDVRGYCAIDAWDSIASNRIHEQQYLEWKIKPEVYTDLKDISLLAELMQQKGIKINMKWVNESEEKADEIKEKLFPYEGEGKDRTYTLFNPRSENQIKKWFETQGLSINSTSKNSIFKALSKRANGYGFNLKDEEGNFSLDALGDADELEPVLDTLYKLYEYKSSGKGLAPWFADKYRDSDNFIHPRFITIGASTTRWSSSRPNFQNIPTRGFGSLVRAAIIPRDPSLDLLKADFSNLEYRTCMYLAGFDVNKIPADAFQWLVNQSEGKFEEAALKAGMDARDIAKSVSHAADYLEGFTLLKPVELHQSNIKTGIERGYLKVYLKKFGAPFDWEFNGKIVAFTGANLAERLFGNKTYENRKKALEIQEEIYFKQFHMLRVWQKNVLDEVQGNGYIRYPTSHFLRLYGSDLNNAKMATAALGQGVSAQHVQGIQLRFWREQNAIPIMAVHDELDFEIPSNWTDKQAYDFIKLMGEETNRLAGFKIPFKAIRGKNWLERKLRKSETHIEGAMKPLVI